ncbi:MAG: RNA chaperone Hfq [Oscillospiraceae bacterium]|nr:RNA chaperone Hfq [Oscillospiraceae bacterium]MBQ4545293.1 RNA chaperone Hfq [Oscillospiraceae bacterium]MBQ6901531.1 RNA chaperone Hfq [Oscillospiraceae bacterium]
MTKTAGLQDVFLNKARSEGVSVTVFLTNGFQLKGYVRGFDCFTVVIVSEGRQQLIYKHAISTVVPSRALRYFDATEEEGQREECVTG